MTRELFKFACLQFLNLPYKWGGDDPIKGYDCSGLVQDLYAMIGLDPKGDQTAQALYHYFNSRCIEGPRQLGTLTFYGKSTLAITHVGMMLDEMHMIEAGGGGSQTNSLDAAAEANAFVRIRPFNHRKDLVAVITPQGLPWLALN
jgi:cell wall-associated NlpC family hydrolase